MKLNKPHTILIALFILSTFFQNVHSQCSSNQSQKIVVQCIPSIVENGSVLAVIPTDALDNFSADPPREFNGYIDDAKVPLLEISRRKVTMIIPEYTTVGMHTVRICVNDGKWAETLFSVVSNDILPDTIVKGSERDRTKQYGNPEDQRNPKVLKPGVTVRNPPGGHGNYPEIPCDSLHIVDGYFTKDVVQNRNEWSGVVPLKGKFSYLYLDFCNKTRTLYLMNDWILGNGLYDSNSCYNLFEFATGGGREKWEIRVYHSIARGMKVIRNGKDVSLDSNYVVSGRSGYSSSPNDTTKHTMYEFGLHVESGVFYMPAQDDPYRPAAGPAITTFCDDKGDGLVREPRFYTATLDEQGCTVQQYNRYITPSGVAGLTTEPSIIRGDVKGDTIRYSTDEERTNNSQVCNGTIVIDGEFTSGEWLGWEPAHGAYSDLYAKYCNGTLHILNDWVLATEEPDAQDCYNLFELYTANGKEQWGIYVYHSKLKGIRVIRNGIDVSRDSNYVYSGAYGWGTSTRFKANHTIYEFAIKAGEGTWMMFLADPGPRSFCSLHAVDVVPEILSRGIHVSVQPLPISDNGYVKVELLQKENLTIAMYNVHGQETIPLYSGVLPEGVSHISIPVKQVAAGMYVVTVKTATDIRNIPVVILH